MSLFDKLLRLAEAEYTEMLADNTVDAAEHEAKARQKTIGYAQSMAKQALGEDTAALLTWVVDESPPLGIEAADAWLDDYARLRSAYDYDAEKSTFTLVQHCPCCEHVDEHAVSVLADLHLRRRPRSCRRVEGLSYEADGSVFRLNDIYADANDEKWIVVGFLRSGRPLLASVLAFESDEHGDAAAGFSSILRLEDVTGPLSPTGLFDVTWRRESPDHLVADVRGVRWELRRERFGTQYRTENWALEQPAWADADSMGPGTELEARERATEQINAWHKHHPGVAE